MATKRSEVDLQRVREIESLLEEEQHKTAQEALAVKKVPCRTHTHSHARTHTRTHKHTHVSCLQAVEEAGLAWAAHRTIEQQVR